MDGDIMTTKLIVIGTSAGGVQALGELFSLLPSTFILPIAVVLHRATIEFDYLVAQLQRSSHLLVQEGGDKLPIRPATITIAPADYHLLIDDQCYALSTENAVEYARPSIDVLMESAADSYGENVLGILLTGGGKDGVQGLLSIKTKGGKVAAQRPDTAQNPTLPQAAIDFGAVTETYSINLLAKLLIQVNDTQTKSEAIN